MTVLRSLVGLGILLLSLAQTGWAQAPNGAPASHLFVRVTLLGPPQSAPGASAVAPANSGARSPGRDTTTNWVVAINVIPGGGKQTDLVVGQKVASDARAAEALLAGQSTPWVDLAPAIRRGVASVRFVFSDGRAPLKGVRARFDVATAPDGQGIVRAITDHDPGDIISLRIPANLARDKKWLLSIREDTQRRLDEVKALKLPDGPLPRKIWCMTGFRSNGQFYTDPAIAQMDFDIIRMLGMNGWWEQNGGQPGPLRTMAHEHGIDRTTIYWRMMENLPHKDLNWTDIERQTDQQYREAAARMHKAYADTGLPQMVVDMADEPDGMARIDGPGYQAQFHLYLQEQGLTPDFFGQKSWGQVTSPALDWGRFFTIRTHVATTPEGRRLLYWSTQFWDQVTARVFAMETRKAEQYAPGLLGTRVNFGPPWLYDYGTLPRGIDAFAFGQLHSVSLGFNEDWVGDGNPRVPLEINTYLMDFSRAAAYPVQPLIGSYVTRDADRHSVKLRTFGLLARQAKIFDFYYYGPAYTFFDHWSDNFSMVQGVAELTRDLGQVDDILWAGVAPKAQVALLYSKSWPVWKEDDTEQEELLMTYLALLHAGVPVDLVSDDQVTRGQLANRNYQALYVVNESIPAAAAPKIEHWVQNGGHLWASGWAGMKDEYNAPTDAWNAMLGITGRSWKPVGDLSRLGRPIEPADWRRPIFGRQVTLEGLPPGAKGDQAQQHPYGTGVVDVVPWTAGKDYMDGAKVVREGPLGHAVIYPTGPRRDVIANFALAAGVHPPATTSVSQVLAWPLWTYQNGVVLLANFTGEPHEEVAVDFATTLPVKKVRSIHHGELKFTHAGDGRVEVKVPVDDVTDILVVE